MPWSSRGAIDWSFPCRILGQAICHERPCIGASELARVHARTLLGPVGGVSAKGLRIVAGADSGPESLRMSVTGTNRTGRRRRIETVNRRLRLVRHVRRTEAGLRAALAGRPECAANEGDRLLRRGYGEGIEVGIPLCGYGGDGKYRAKATTVRQNTETLPASATASTDDGTVAAEVSVPSRRESSDGGVVNGRCGRISIVRAHRTQRLAGRFHGLTRPPPGLRVCGRPLVPPKPVPR